MKASMCRCVMTAILLTTIATIAGCKTNEQGVKSTYRSQWTTVAGDPTDVAEASKDVLEDLRLQRIDSRATGVDGVVSGYTADNTKINIDIKKAGETTSQVSVNVGALGDPALGKDILSRIQNKLAK